MNQRQLLRDVQKLMQNNRRQAGTYSYTSPSPDSYPYQWFWDSCFHAIILSHFDPHAAQQELRALAAWQFENGMIPHMIYWQKATNTSFPKIRWGKRHTSSLIQPPLLARAVWKIYGVTQDRGFLKEMLPVINKLHDYLMYYRDPHRHNLIGLVNPDESGEDNSPRFDTALHLPAKQTIDKNYHHRMRLIAKYRGERFVIKKHMERLHWVRDVPINAILVDSFRHANLIAAELEDVASAAQADKLAKAVASAMRGNMLDGDLMWSTTGLSYRPIKLKTWGLFAPLFGGVLLPDEASGLVEEHLTNPNEFKTPYGVPTVSLDEPSFDPAGFWRGPVWMASNWFIYNGLLDYGFHKEAHAVLESSLALLKKSGFREQYNPLTGDGQGALHFTWGGLVLDMLDRASV